MVDGYYDQLPEMFDPAAHEGTQDLVAVPAGWYLAHIVEAEVRDAANGNGNYLWTAFEIIEGQYKGRKVFHNVTIHNASQQAVESANGFTSPAASPGRRGASTCFYTSRSKSASTSGAIPMANTRIKTV